MSLLKIGARRYVTANKWAEVFINDDFNMFMQGEFTEIEKSFRKDKNMIYIVIGLQNKINDRMP